MHPIQFLGVFGDHYHQNPSYNMTRVGVDANRPQVSASNFWEFIGRFGLPGLSDSPHGEFTQGLVGGQEGRPWGRRVFGKPWAFVCCKNLPSG